MSRLNALATVGLGAILLGLGVYSLRGALVSRGWATTEGVVIHSGTTVGRRGALRADVRYTYSVAGQSFTGTRKAEVFFADGEEQVRRYPVREHVRVYYDPHDAGSSLLQLPGLYRGLLAAGAGLAMIIYYSRLARAR